MSSESIWSGPVKMRWDGDNMMLGAVCIGTVWPLRKQNGWYCGLGIGAKEIPLHSTYAEARRVLVAAAVRALEGDHV